MLEVTECDITNMESSSPSHRHGGGRDRATYQRQDRFLLIQSRRQRFQNATSLNSVSILIKDVSWCGECLNRDLMNLMWQNMTVMARS